VAVVAFEGAMVDFFVDAAGLLGVPRSVAAIYGIVFASPVPLSFADIGARLDISKGSVSQGLRMLREVGALRAMSSELGAGNSELGARSWELGAAAPPARGVLYEPDLEMRQLIQRFIERRLQQQLDTGKGRLKALNREVAAFAAGEQKVLRQRLLKLSRWHDRTRALLPVARTFLKLG
jgi:DNA-binding transcriptional ArsR family regulator